MAIQEMLRTHSPTHDVTARTADRGTRPTGATSGFSAAATSTFAPPQTSFAASFADDPAYSYVLPNRNRRARALRTFLAAPVRDAVPFEAAFVAVEDADVIGAPFWLPPGAYP